MSPANEDYYRLLGVNRDAGSDEIKREFRRKAKELHPDSNRGDKKREEKFKELNEAYDVLSDPAKRKEYDVRAAGPGVSTAWEDVFNQSRPGRSRPRPQEKQSGGGFFEHLFGSPQNRSKANGGAKESYVETEMSISLEEALKGSSRRIALTIREKSKFGKAKVTEKMLDVKIPAGIREGQRIRLKSPGSSRGAKTEDVFIKIHIAPHPVFEFEGRDLVAKLKVSPWEAALGKNVRVPTLNGTADIRLPVGISSGQKLRLKGRGFPEMGSGKKGDLFYRIMIVLPQKMTVEEEELFKRFDSVSRFKPREGS